MSESVTPAPEAELELAGPSYTDDPHSLFRQLRDHSPVRRVRLDGVSAWLVLNKDDICAVASDSRIGVDPALANDEARQVPWIGAGTATTSLRHMLRTDPPDHSRLRKLVSAAFTPQRILALEPDVRRTADRLVTNFVAEGHAELVTQFSRPFSAAVLSAILGVPEEDLTQFSHWIDIYAGSTPEDVALLPEVIGLIQSYVRELIGKRRDADILVDDYTILDALIRTADETDRLTDDELFAMTCLLLLAGFETTATFIGNCMLTLLTRPGLLASLRADPTMIPAAVEELLRFEGPVKVSPAARFARESLNLGDTAIQAGDAVVLGYSSASRDPLYHSAADEVDIARTDTGHLAFGHGAHYCLGAALARMETRTALEILLSRLADIHLSVDPTALQWRRSRILRGLIALPVEFTPAAS